MISETFLDGRVTLHIGDVRATLRELPSDYFDCVVTSPPYYGLRDYQTGLWEGGDADCAHERTGTTRTPWANSVKGSGNPGKNGSAYANMTKTVGGHCTKCSAVFSDMQIGMESTLDEHLCVMVEVFEEVKRVLKPTGTLWLNYGDCYATSPNGRSAADTKAAGNDDRTFRDKPFSTIGGIFKAKDLMMIPNRLAIALQEAGWYVRSEIIWHKPNPMPDSIKDRPGSSHEKVWLLSKRDRYFYDSEAVREPAVKTGTPGHLKSGQNSRENVRRTPGSDKQSETAANSNPATARRMAGFNARYDEKEASGEIPSDRNLRNVWTIGTSAFPEAHFATFPPDLAERCIKAGSSEVGACGCCGAPWKRQTEVAYENPGNRTTNGPRSTENRAQTAGFAVRLEKKVKTLGFAPSCDCPDPSPVPSRILDIFGGAGTTALVAAMNGRHCDIIELNPEYAILARARIEAAFMGKEEGVRHMTKQLGKDNIPFEAGSLFAPIETEAAE